MTYEDRLRDRFSKASEALPGQSLDWTETYNRARRGRTIYLAAVAFGTAVVLALGAFGTWTVLGARGGGPAPIDPAHTQTPDPEPSPTAVEPPPDESVSYEAPYAAVDTFIQGAADGDPEAVWAVMTDLSRAVFDNDLERFRESEFSAIAEGWGSWAAADEVGRHWGVLVSSGDGVMGVVTLMGSRAPEGREEPYAAAAIPVRVNSQGDAKVEPFVSEGVIECVTPRDLSGEQQPALDTVTTEQPTFEALVPDAAIEVGMVAAPVPDEPAVSISGTANIEGAAGDRVRAVWTPDERLFSSEWFLTVVAIYEDGSMQAQSARFEIE